MAFGGCQNTYASFPNFSTNTSKASATQDDGAYGSLGQPFFPSPGFSLPDNHHTPLSNNNEQLLRCTQDSTRNLSHGTDCDSVTDLYGLVSNILEDGDSLDSFSHTERASSKFTSIWSPQAAGNDLLQFSQSDTTTEVNPAFFPHHKNNEHAQGQTISQEMNTMFQFYGLNSSNQWLSKSPNGDTDSYKPPSVKLTKPPCLPIPSMESCFLSAVMESQQNLSNDTSRGTLGPLKNIQKNGFGHQGRLDSHLVNDYEDHYIQSGLALYQQNSPQDVNNLVSHFKDLMVTQDRMVEENNQMKWTNSAMFPDSVSRMLVKGAPRGDTGSSQREQNGGIMQNTFQGNYGFQGHNAKHIQQSTSHSASCNPQKPYQGKTMTQGQTPSPNINQVLNQHSINQIQQSQLPNQASMDRGYLPSMPFNQCQPLSEFGPCQFPQMQRSPFCKQNYSSRDGSNVPYGPGQTQMGMNMDPYRNGDGDSGLQAEKSKLRSPAGGFVQGGFLSTKRAERNPRLRTNTQSKDTRVTRHGPPQSNHYHFPQPGNHSLRFGVGNSTAGTGKPPQFLPFTYPVSDPSQSSFQMGVNSKANPSFRPSQPYRGAPSCQDISDRRPEGEFAAFKPNVAFQKDQSAGSVHPHMASTTLHPGMTKNRGGPMSQLHHYLEECCDQLTCLEKERKKSVILLNKTFPGKRISVATSTLLPKMPPNPSRVDRLIVDQTREQARVVNLLGKMESLSSIPFHGNISSSLDRHYEAIYATQTQRREEYINSASRQKQGRTHCRDDTDITLLAVALKDLCRATRKSRTALWCALQVTVPMSVGVLDINGDTETAEDSGQERL